MPAVRVHGRVSRAARRASDQVDNLTWIEIGPVAFAEMAFSLFYIRGPY
jgi:hypothetical protein